MFPSSPSHGNGKLLLVKAHRKSNFFVIPNLIRNQDPPANLRAKFGTTPLDSGSSLRLDRNDSGEESKVANIFPDKITRKMRNSSNRCAWFALFVGETLTKKILNQRITFCNII